jgi:zinc/manganese transport system permease protein
MISSEMLEIIGPALVAGLMVALTHAPLGLEVIKRGIIFIDLAVAQIAGLGLVVASVLLHEPSLFTEQAIALSFALGAGIFFRAAETLMPRQLEAIIGCSFVFSASLALLLLANQPHGAEEVQYMLSGQILFVTWHDVLLHAPVYMAILLLWFVFPIIRRRIGFYLLFAAAITSSVQLVGVYVVFASLILPALAAMYTARRHVWTWSCGTLSVIAGIMLATAFDMPAGPLIVMAYTVVTVTFFFLWYVLVGKKSEKMSGSKI